MKTKICYDARMMAASHNTWQCTTLGFVLHTGVAQFTVAHRVLSLVVQIILFISFQLGGIPYFIDIAGNT